MSELYLGLMSGTSIDGVDAVLADINDTSCQVLHAATTAFPAPLLARLSRIVEVPQTTLRELGALDHALGEFFADCALDLVQRSGVPLSAIAAIGHHGQTIFHQPTGPERFTMQIGDPNVVAAKTGIVTVADFRRLDMACGGQGAPLVPAFHVWRFGHATEQRAVVNIGGIANITALHPNQPTVGFDTGPGNTLLDLWIRRCRGQSFDDDGRYAASGRADETLLSQLLQDPFFAAPAPKSTGRELFNMEWLERQLAGTRRIADADVQATLAELTAATVVAGVHGALDSCRRLIVCGGGARNADLLSRLQRRTQALVETTAAHGLSADWVEGAAFAWLARARLRMRPGNLPSVTGARRAAVLGGVYWGSAP
jgi:anhydro-N-acetylmuramic acid kinase